MQSGVRYPDPRRMGEPGSPIFSKIIGSQATGR